MDETRKWLAMGVGYGVGVALGLTLGSAGAALARQAVERREYPMHLTTGGRPSPHLLREAADAIEAQHEPKAEPEPDEAPPG